MLDSVTLVAFCSRDGCLAAANFAAAFPGRATSPFDRVVPRALQVVPVSPEENQILSFVVVAGQWAELDSALRGNILERFWRTYWSTPPPPLDVNSTPQTLLELFLPLTIQADSMNSILNCLPSCAIAPDRPLLRGQGQRDAPCSSRPGLTMPGPGTAQAQGRPGRKENLRVDPRDGRKETFVWSRYRSIASRVHNSQSPSLPPPEPPSSLSQPRYETTSARENSERWLIAY
ncbi:hypothetical protein F4775DRAFT_587719 [Biscogniauxia sp. FL1348]|nr:hypothetical protein F4775DRAFT_587719 [Biscogniauxia sp. FL1348]